MVDRSDSTLEVFDSSVFVEAIADTSGKRKDARQAINEVKTAQNRIPVFTHEVIGEVSQFLSAGESFETEEDRRMANLQYRRLEKGFKIISPDVSDLITELTYIRDNKTRIVKELNDSLILAKALAADADKVFTIDKRWNLEDKDTKVVLI